MTDQEQHYLRDKFSKYDADGSGGIDVSELQALMTEVTGETPTTDEVGGFLRSVDANDDGTLDFDEFLEIFVKARAGELEFGGLKLAMDAFHDLIDDELDSDEERPPSPAPEAVARRGSALGADDAGKRGAKTKAKATKATKTPAATGDVEDPSMAPRKPPVSGRCACCVAWFNCVFGSTVLYSRTALRRAIETGCPCCPPKGVVCLVCVVLPLLWVWMSLKLLLLPCLAIYLARGLAVPKKECYKALMRCASRVGCMVDLRYHDPFFRCVDGPMSGFTDSEHKAVATVVQWKRPAEIFGDDFKSRASLFKDGISPDDVDQGTLGDCWLLAAFASAAEFPGMIRRAFLTTEANWIGRYVVTLFDGATRQWCKIVVDDRIPCRDGTCDPIFCKPAGAELWVLLLEKAFAKFVGGYHNLAGGFSIWALQALTGDDAYTLSREKGKEPKPWYRTDMQYAPTPENKRHVKWVHHLGPDGDPERFDDDALFRMILQYDALNFVMCASTSIPDRQDGLIGGHAYTLSAAAEVKRFRLVKLRNPWGNFEWTGDWCDASDLWKKHPDVAKACHVDAAKGEVDDGVFWMAYDDFLRYFDSVDVLKRSEDLHDIYLETGEDSVCPACGPFKGCVAGCCCYYVACKGATKLCCGRETDDSTVEVDEKRNWCCGGSKRSETTAGDDAA